MEKKKLFSKSSETPKKRVGIPSIGIREPIKKTMYDVLLDNLKLAKRTTFIHRMIYAGEHKFSMEPDEDEILPIQRFFQNIITEVNSDSFVFEELTGFLVYYKKYFIHVVEGDEDAINNHLKLLYKPENEEFFKNLKLFAQIHHINARYMNDWTCHYGSSRRMVAQVEIITRADISMRICYCIKKIYSLFNLIESEAAGSATSLTDIESTVPTRFSVMSELTIVQQMARNKFSPFVPETEILEMLLNSEFLTDLKYFLNTYHTIADMFIHEDRKWPIPLSPIPFSMFGTDELKYRTRLSQFMLNKKSSEKDENNSDGEENHE